LGRGRYDATGPDPVPWRSKVMTNFTIAAAPALIEFRERLHRIDQDCKRVADLLHEEDVQAVLSRNTSDKLTTLVTVAPLMIDLSLGENIEIRKPLTIEQKKEIGAKADLTSGD
jgi:hypothetical protein